MTQPSIKPITKNKRAFFDYAISEKLEAGIALVGCEVKSVRAQDISLKDSYVHIKDGEAWLINCHIAPYTQGNRANPDPERNRKLLLHRHEIDKLLGKMRDKSQVLVPLQVYIKGNRIKVEIGLGTPKKLYDKRRDLKEKTVQRDIQRGLRR